MNPKYILNKLKIFPNECVEQTPTEIILEQNITRRCGLNQIIRYIDERMTLVQIKMDNTSYVKKKKSSFAKTVRSSRFTTVDTIIGDLGDLNARVGNVPISSMKIDLSTE